jgi:hypothetical protein
VVTLSHNKHIHTKIFENENGKLLCKTLYPETGVAKSAKTFLHFHNNSTLSQGVFTYCFITGLKYQAHFLSEAEECLLRRFSLYLKIMGDIFVSHNK